MPTQTFSLSKRQWLAGAGACAIWSSVGQIAHAETKLTGPGEPIEIGKGYDIQSLALGHTRRVNISLPTGYDDPENAATRYPVLYLLDGGADWQDFAHIASLVQQGGTWGASAAMIVVGIESQDRKAEFTAPTRDPQEQKDFPTSGKAALFRRFLIDELRPLINATYRANGTNALMGESLAGLFVVETALRSGSLFKDYIAISPSLWWDGERLSKDAEKLLKGSRPAHYALWLAIADEGGTMQTGMDRLVAALRSDAGSSVTWTYRPYPTEKHSTIYHPAATEAIRALFPAK
ncbi:hypothetical protein MMA231_00459 [Asticcacaulis sp. MM231]|uniref:alpha/beta hydrolase n=1 Tax=Asticcacaulis sp. MM231 TaxID=3157666 RepID=UPI0032D58B81